MALRCAVSGIGATLDGRTWHVVSSLDAPHDHIELEALRRRLRVPERAYVNRGTPQEALELFERQMESVEAERFSIFQLREMATHKRGYDALTEPPDVEYT